MLAIVDISGDFAMGIVHSALRVFVAGDAGEHRKVACIRMAVRAGRPPSSMVAGVNREIWAVMIKGRRRPC